MQYLKHGMSDFYEDVNFMVECGTIKLLFNFVSGLHVVIR